MSRILRITTSTTAAAQNVSSRLTCEYCVMQREFRQLRGGGVLLELAHVRGCRRIVQT